MKPRKNGIFSISTGGGFLPSTVSQWVCLSHCSTQTWPGTTLHASIGRVGVTPLSFSLPSWGFGPGWSWWSFLGCPRFLELQLVEHNGCLFKDEGTNDGKFLVLPGSCVDWFSLGSLTDISPEGANRLVSLTTSWLPAWTGCFFAKDYEFQRPVG